ncbi:hypothetical protein K402DRAFT_404412 [Aulographum hederae CBS 113979]|uniref:Uncharacterized protein n=1 Tax=Aulographum hederae CBS 113979 TaxID=1176131 RepID=A0A6G1GZD9_9PEZI|nr:hypothetical protein K402DRAFT_404412 [Aulographum hederae CBS 113979]
MGMVVDLVLPAFRHHQGFTPGLNISISDMAFLEHLSPAMERLLLLPAELLHHLLDSPLSHPKMLSNISLATTLATLLATSILIFYVFTNIFTRSTKPEPQPFRFLDLPAELREQVYEYVATDPVYPSHPPTTTSRTSAGWLRTHIRALIPAPLSLRVKSTIVSSIPISSSLLSPTKPHIRPSSTAVLAPPTGGKALLFSSSQLHSEYLSHLLRTRTFHLPLSTFNTTPPTPSPSLSPPTSPSPTISTPTTTPTAPLWPLPPSTLTNLRHLHIPLLATPALLGTHVSKFDPRLAPPSLSWPVLDRCVEALEGMRELRTLGVSVRAVGNPLWNPLWLWHFAGVAFMGGAGRGREEGKIEGAGADGEADGDGDEALREKRGGIAVLDSIRFELDGWTPGENYLARRTATGKNGQDTRNSEETEWEWRCPTAHHSIGAVGPGQMPIRQFCAMLYRDCETCAADAGVGDKGDLGLEELV